MAHYMYYRLGKELKLMLSRAFLSGAIFRTVIPKVLHPSFTNSYKPTHSVNIEHLLCNSHSRTKG